MDKPEPFDPFANWRELVSQVERVIDQVARKTANSGEIGRDMNKLSWGPLMARKLIADLANRLSQRINTPTRADIVALGERRQRIEDRLIDMRHRARTVGRSIRNAQRKHAKAGFGQESQHEARKAQARGSHEMSIAKAGCGSR